MKEKRMLRRVFTYVGIGIGVLTIATVLFLLIWFYYRGFTLDLKVNEKEEITIEVGTSFQNPTAEAVATGVIWDRKGVAVEVQSSGQVNATKLGDYEISYHADYKDASADARCMVHVVDTTDPVLTLAGEEKVLLDTGVEYEEAGFAASDNYDGDLTDKVTVEGSVDISIMTPQELRYTVTDSSGNSTSLTRIVQVRDTLAPEIGLSGNYRTYIPVGTAYEEPGYWASDNADGDITGKVSVSGSVDCNTPGAYYITYYVQDEAGNEASVTRTIRVYKTVNSTAVNPGDKVIYLTFDDGPGPYTQRLLDILDMYNVKVTFFVTNMKGDYQWLIAEEARRGHTVALHTYSHVYSSVYASIDSYFADLNAINEVVKAQTGSYANILRFPGGSSNTTSAKYCRGIMSSLVHEVTDQGYLYCDWNVSSGDAGGTTSTYQVVQNVISGCSSKSVSIVLQHDIKNFSVDAVEEIICWGLSEGYTFLPMDSSTPMYHHPVAN